MPSFVPGQRWLSETQSELGLGIVESVAPRRVEVCYRATGERRVYALPNPPLVRVILEVGEWVRDRAGRAWLIQAVEEGDTAGLIRYRCVDGSGALCRLSEAELDDHLRLNRPAQRLLSARFDADHWFDLRWRTWRLRMREALSPVQGLLGARIALLAHQLEIASEVARREAPRVLLADEVGLGKTIEAGLILHQMLLTGRAARVLVMTPEPLLHQWLVEMLRRFNLRFALFDQERFASLPDANPFLADQLVLCSADWILRLPAAEQALVSGQWDLLVVDEAHHLEWSEDRVSNAYRLVAQLAARTPGVLLLTATPEQLGRAGHFGRLRLLDPQRFSDYERFVAEERDHAPVAALAGRLLDGEPLGAADQALISARLGEHEGLERATILERLLDRHGTGRVMFRNTRASIPGFPGRVLHPAPLPEPAAYAALNSRDCARLTPERSLGPDWLALDPRIDWLIALLARLHPHKVLLICAAASTVLELRDVLLRRSGIHAAVFHEGLALRERDRAAAYFAAVEDGTRILLCSEIGSEGRNFQFVHHLVLFDLPLDPDRLEQRIGRLDRIGQQHPVQLHVPYLVGGPSEVLFRWYAQGLQAFEAICPAAPAVYQDLIEPLHAALADPRRTVMLVAEAQRRCASLNQQLAAGRDRLLELHSHRPERGAALVAALLEEEQDPALAEYLRRLWDHFGVEYEPAAHDSLALRPGAHMLNESFPELPADGLQLTFSRSVALAHEHWAFITREHPMVRGAMDLLIAGDRGAVALGIMRDERFAPTSLLLEALYVVECQAPRGLEADRYLPLMVRRFLVDPAGCDHADAIAHDAIDARCASHHPHLAQALLSARAESIRSLIETVETMAQAAMPALRTAARARMNAVLSEEIARLRALAAINPNVRPDEIAALTSRREQLDQALSGASLRLDALRLLVTR
ncbi:RNA polymerase-binding ATPase [Thiocapsa imhoffii]|uniref:RNA polymerase-associated protein RapA n=1 Tax=Thiocapsa imhoffii TaxID=382777 RepID=A0A9X1B7M0_9GAMM|nr:RNA polymerase-associated protein RapA [Thiocapsa imhoffii]MBK1643984.1 RNA polymerase-binding ATPase [Thiocapsa imhoffii]